MHAITYMIWTWELEAFDLQDENMEWIRKGRIWTWTFEDLTISLIPWIQYLFSASTLHRSSGQLTDEDAMPFWMASLPNVPFNIHQHKWSIIIPFVLQRWAAFHRDCHSSSLSSWVPHWAPRRQTGMGLWQGPPALRWPGRGLTAPVEDLTRMLDSYRPICDDTGSCWSPTACHCIKHDRDVKIVLSWKSILQFKKSIFFNYRMYE